MRWLLGQLTKMKPWCSRKWLHTLYLGKPSVPTSILSVSAACKWSLLLPLWWYSLPQRAATHLVTNEQEKWIEKAFNSKIVHIPYNIGSFGCHYSTMCSPYTSKPCNIILIPLIWTLISDHNQCDNESFFP